MTSILDEADELRACWKEGGLTFRGSTRLVMATHISDGTFRSCDVCLKAVDDDHDEALEVEASR